MRAIMHKLIKVIFALCHNKNNIFVSLQTNTLETEIETPWKYGNCIVLLERICRINFDFR